MGYAFTLPLGAYGSTTYYDNMYFDVSYPQNDQQSKMNRKQGKAMAKEDTMQTKVSSL